MTYTPDFLLVPVVETWDLKFLYFHSGNKIKQCLLQIYL